LVANLGISEKIGRFLSITPGHPGEQLKAHSNGLWICRTLQLLRKWKKFILNIKMVQCSADPQLVRTSLNANSQSVFSQQTKNKIIRLWLTLGRVASNYVLVVSVSDHSLKS